MAAFVVASAMCPNAEAMTFYNNSDHNVFVFVVRGHDGFQQTKGSFKRDLRPGESWSYSPGNLHMQSQRDYTYFVWTSFDAWHKAEGFGAFLGALSFKYHVVDSWLRVSSTYSDPRKWPDGLLMIGEGFDDDDNWLRYYGKGHTPFAEKGGCTCAGAGWTRSGYGCSGRDWGLSGFDKPTTRPARPDKACTNTEQLTKATYKGKNACPAGSFFDPRSGGECWSCPEGNNRSLLAVTDSKACSKPAYDTYKKAVKRRQNTRAFQGCPAGQFWDAKGGNGLLGACYSCEPGYRRTVAAVDSAGSCVKTIPEQFSSATFVEKAGCQKWPGSFFDPREGGECWDCGKGLQRTLSAVTGDEACKKPPHVDYKASTPFTSRLSPP